MRREFNSHSRSVEFAGGMDGADSRELYDPGFSTFRSGHALGRILYFPGGQMPTNLFQYDGGGPDEKNEGTIGLIYSSALTSPDLHVGGHRSLLLTPQNRSYPLFISLVYSTESVCLQVW